MSRKARKKNYNKYRNKKGGDYLRVIQGGALQRKRQKEVNIVPRNFHQDDLLGLLEDRNINIVFAVGPAGTGKTLISTLAGIKSLKNNKINKLFCIFSGWKGVFIDKNTENKRTPIDAETVGKSVGTLLDIFLVIKSRIVIKKTAINA